MSKPHRFLAFVVGLIGFAAIIAAVVLSLTSSSEAQPQADEFELIGRFDLVDGATGGYADGPDCKGYRGYDDIREGTQVTVYDSRGEVLGIGQLRGAEYTPAGVCEFEFNVHGVPVGKDFYQVEVSHRGKIAVRGDQARAGQVSLTLGSSTR